MIEKSFDGINFTPIEASATKPENKNGVTKYTFVDANTTENLVYYRLVAHHTDGNKLNLKIITADKNINQNKKVVIIYPNPSTGACTIKFSSEVVLSGKKYFVRNSNGVIVKEGLITSSLQNIDLQVEPGIYILETENFEGSSFQKIVIEPKQ